MLTPRQIPALVLWQPDQLMAVIAAGCAKDAHPTVRREFAGPRPSTLDPQNLVRQTCPLRGF